MIWVAIFAPYTLVALLVARLLAGHFAWRMVRIQKQTYPSLYRNTDLVPDGDKWCGAILLGLLCGLLWPAALVFLIPLPWAVGAEADARLETAQARIAKLERELALR